MVSVDEHVDDVCLDRYVWKGLLKVLLAIVHGLEVTAGSGHLSATLGTASGFRALEVAHTHYWSREEANEAATDGAATLSTTTGKAVMASAVSVVSVNGPSCVAVVRRSV